MALPKVIRQRKIKAGDNFIQPVRFGSNGAPTDLVAAGWTDWAAQWRETPDSDTFFAMTVDDSQASAGVITVSLPGEGDESTRTMAHNGYWDLQSKNADIGITDARTWVMQPTIWEDDVTRVDS